MAEHRRDGLSPVRLCVIEGDGIGHEVVPAALAVLSSTGFPIEVVHADAGWDCFLERGMALPPETLELARQCDAILFGAVSSPSHKVAGYSSPIVELRRQLDLYANLRPSHSWPIPTSRPGIDLLIVRENTEDLYVRRERSDGHTAVAERVITRQGSERVARVACQWATRRRRRLTIVHKANVLPETCGLFRQVALDVAAEHPDLEVEEMLVDTMALRLVTTPERFDVIVTTNLFGDILSDEDWWREFEAESKKDRAWTGDQLVGDLKAMIPEANWGGNTNEEALSGRGLMDLIKRAIPNGNWEEEKPAR